MERWRSFFNRANADIWTVIEKALLVAAVYHPEDFKEKRCLIAETLFSRTLLLDHGSSSRSVVEGPPGKDEFPLEDGELRDDGGGGGGGKAKKVEGGEAEDDDDNEEEELELPAEGRDRTMPSHGDAARQGSDPCSTPDQEALLRQKIEKIRLIIVDENQPERVLIGALQSLEELDITVNALRVTEIGRQVNNLRKHSSKQIRASVKRLVKYWKLLVDEWVSVAEDEPMVASTTTLSECRDGPRAANPVKGSSHFSSPYTGGAITSSSEASQHLSFVDGGLQERTKSCEVEAPSKGSFYGSSRSQSCVRPESSDCDAKLNYGFGTPGEMGSATRDNESSGSIEKVWKSSAGESRSWHDTGLRPTCALPLVKPSTSARPSGESKVSLVYRPSAKERPVQGLSNVNRRQTSEKDGGGNHMASRSLVDKKVEMSQADQKLEVAKRKLHEGYQQAENAKKQRTVQVLDFPDLPKMEVRGKASSSLHERGGLFGGYGGQNRRCG